MINVIPGVPDVVEGLNKELPADIRVWGYVKSFTG